MSCLTSIHVLIFATHLHPGDVSAPSRSLELHLNSIHVQSQTHPNLKMCVSPISRACLICIHVSRFLHQLLQCTFSPPSRPRKMQINSIQAHIKLILVSECVLSSTHVLPHQLPGPKILVSSPSMYRLISIQVQGFLSHLHPCTVPLPPGQLHWYLTSKHVTSHIQPGLSFVSRLYPGHIQLTCRSRE